MIVTSINDIKDMEIYELKALHMNKSSLLNTYNNNCDLCRYDNCEDCFIDGKIISIMDELNMIKDTINSKKKALGGKSCGYVENVAEQT